jgi:DNA-binding PadR family transcriptional regulator
MMSDPTLLVLASLAGGQKHGYAIMEDIERFAGVRLGPGTLYGAITRLNQRKWIHAVPSDDRRQPYEITSAGLEYLTLQLKQLDQVVKVGRRRVRQA